MDQSHLEILESNPTGNRLDGFRAACALNFKDKGRQDVNNEELKNTLVDLLLAVQSLPAPRYLPSKKRSKNLLHDLIRLSLAVNSGIIDTVRIEPLLDTVLNKKPGELIWDTVYDAMTVSASPPGTLSSFPRAPWSQNEMQSISTSASLLSCPFLLLPPEIRCMIYRILLRSERHVRMIPPPQDEYHIPCPNNLYPSILGTCRLIYQEAHYVLYGENSFHAHRIDEDNDNAASIRRAKYCIGLHEREDGEDEARKLAQFLSLRKELRFLELEFGFDLLEDPSIYDLVRQAIEGHRRLMHINILSPVAFSEMGWRHSWRLWRIVRDQAVLLEWLEENVVK